MRSERPSWPIPSHHVRVQTTDDRSRTLIDCVTGAAYHSASGALAETRHVYLDNSGVADRIKAGEPTRVLEIGLGTGMAMLLTLDAAIDAGVPLEYLALETRLLDSSVIAELNLDEHLVHPRLGGEFRNWRESLGVSPTRGVHRWEATDRHLVVVHHGDALHWSCESPLHFDAIYFDPFAPDVNPELWDPALLGKMHTALQPDGKLVTYCVSRLVREAFVSVGFHVERVRGPKDGKREVMIASKS